MDHRRADIFVGLFILVGLGVITGALIVTSGIGEKHYDLYMRTETAKDLSQDTRVVLQGLEIGRVRQVNPVVDSATGRLGFIARLRIDESFPDGTPVALPILSRAVIAQPSPIAPPVIQIDIPMEGRKAIHLLPGDTIVSERRAGAFDQIGTIADMLGSEITATLEAARATMAATRRTMNRVTTVMSGTGPRVESVLNELIASLERADRVLATFEPRVEPILDSVTATVNDARQIVNRLDSAAGAVQTIAVDSRGTLEETVQHLERAAATIERLAEQVSLRPLRIITGVKPEDTDTTVTTTQP